MPNTNLTEFVRMVTPQTTQDISPILDLFENRLLKKGEAVLNAGELCREIYFVESGYLRTYHTKDGDEINLYFHLEGSIASDHKNAKAGIPSDNTIAAGEPSEVWVLDRQRVTELCQTDPEIKAFVVRLVNRMLLDLSSHSPIFKIYTPRERYEYIEKHDARLIQRVSLSHLASYLGITRRTLTRIRAQK